MTTALGVVETIGTETSFASETLRPAVPGIGGSSTGVAARRSPSSDVKERISAFVDESIASSLRSAEASATSMRTSTTVAALAQAHQAAAAYDEAAKYAEEALELSISQSRRGISDPMATKIALEVLLRGQKTRTALKYAGRLPLSDYLKLEIATVLAGQRRFQEAHAYIEDSGASQRDAVLGYVRLLEGEYSSAVSTLRSALRSDPMDADAALNLSIALAQLGSNQKSISAALHARKAAPGRPDIAAHLLEMLLIDGNIERAQRELKSIAAHTSEQWPRLLIVDARIKLAQGKFSRAVRLLEQAAEIAENQGDEETVAEVRSNLVQLRVVHGEIDRDAGFALLLRLSREIPDSDVVVANLARVAWRTSQAADLETRLTEVQDSVNRPRLAFIEYELATLRGENERASACALEWLRLEPNNPRAATAVLVALGIGEERWNEAAKIALRVANNSNHDGADLNNAAYVLAMAGMGPKAVELLTPVANQSYVYKATLGLAYLASEQIELGMKLYRQAADSAERLGDDARSLMTAYQALVVRQLGVLYAADEAMVSALALPPYPLPDDWEDRPEFVRLRNVATRRGFEWPLAL